MARGNGSRRLPAGVQPGETGQQDYPPNTFDVPRGNKTTWARGAENTPEPRWHGGYHDHGYNPGVEPGGPPSAQPRPPLSLQQKAGLLGEGDTQRQAAEIHSMSQREATRAHAEALDMAPVRGGRGKLLGWKDKE